MYLEANTYLSPSQRNTLYVRARDYGVKLQEGSRKCSDKATKCVSEKEYDLLLNKAKQRFKEKGNMKTMETINKLTELRALHMIKEEENNGI